MKKYILLILILFLGLAPIKKAHCGENLETAIEPNMIIIGASYHGTTFKVTGKIPTYAEAVINVVGQKKDTAFKKKGKALGFLWMNLGTVVFHDVPNLYLLYLSNTYDAEVLPAGLDVLKNKISISPDTEDKDFLFDEFIKLKTKEGLYSTVPNAIQYGKISNGMKSFTCTVKLPSKLVPGTYQVRVIAMRNNKIIANSVQNLKVKEEGLPNLVAFLAINYSTLYGILATVIAIIAGLIMGVVFKGGKGGH